MGDYQWNYEQNPLCDRAQFYLNTLKSDRFSGHPVRDLVEILFECYGFLSEILENYRGSGEDSQDAIVVALSTLFAHWPPEKLAEIRTAMRENSSDELSGGSKKRRESVSAKLSMTSILSVSSKMLSGMKKGFSSKNRNDTTRASDLTPDQAPSSPSRSRTASKTPSPRPTEKKHITSPPPQDDTKSKSETKSSQSSTESSSHPPPPPLFDSPPPLHSPVPSSNSPPRNHSPAPVVPRTQSKSPSPASSACQTEEEIEPATPTPLEFNPSENQEEGVSFSSATKDQIAPPINSPLAGNGMIPTGGIGTKNQEYFKKMREDEEVAKKTKEEEESKLTPHELKKIEEEKKQQELHDANKTAHLSKLGSNFIVRKDGRVNLDGAGRGGRGRGR